MDSLGAGEDSLIPRGLLRFGSFCNVFMCTRMKYVDAIRVIYTPKRTKDIEMRRTDDRADPINRDSLFPAMTHGSSSCTSRIIN